jgi:hypothetical protein
LDKAHNPNWKLGPRTIPVIYVGLADWQNKKAYLVFGPKQHKYIATVNLKVDPTFFPCRKKGERRIDSWDMYVYDAMWDQPNLANCASYCKDIISTGIHYEYQT